MVGCATQPAQFKIHSSKDIHVWPKPPERPRYQFEGFIFGESNFIKDKSSQNIGAKFWYLLTGLIWGGGQSNLFVRPQAGLMDDARQRIYVTDVGRKGVWLLDKQKGKIELLEAASRDEGFKTPIALALASDGNVWVTDADLRRIIKLDPVGEPIETIKHQQLQRPTGIARDPRTDQLFVADSASHNIKVFAESGELLRTIGAKGEQPGQFNGPTHLAIAKNRLYVVDTLNSRVQIFSTDGKFLKTFGKRGLYLGDMPRPKGIAVDASGRIYVVESYHDYLLVYDAEGRLLLPFGGSGKGIGQFYLPAGVWTDSQDRIYVADMFNGRIAVFRYLDDEEAQHITQQLTQ
jgi:DNA-binding beta-propeller fold protein YncE